MPTPKRAASGYIGQLTAPRAAGEWGDSALDLKLDAELPSLFSDLELGEVLDAELPGFDSGVVQPLPAFLGLDLRDLPAPVGPRPRSPLSLRSPASGAAVELRGPASTSRAPAQAAAPGPVSRPLGLAEPEPAPLPAPPPRGPLADLVNTVPVPALTMPAMAAAGEGMGTLRTELAKPGSSADGLVAPQPGKRVSNPAIALPALTGSPPGKRASSPAMAIPAPGGPPPGKRTSNPGMVVPPLGGPPPGKRVSNPGMVIPLPRELIERETQSLPRRSSQPGLAMLNKPVHALFDASEAPPQPSSAGKAADSEPASVSLPALPSDDSGARQTAGSDSSGMSVLSGSPAASSTVTAEPRPVRLGYLIAGLALLAILLTVIIAHIAGTWHKHALPGSDRAAPAKPQPPTAPPETGPY